MLADLHGGMLTYSASATPVTISLSGVTLDTNSADTNTYGEYCSLAGTQITASLVPCSYYVLPGSTFNWSCSGSGTFKNFDPTQNHFNQLTMLGQSEFTGSSFTFYDYLTENFTVSCSATWVAPDGTPLKVTAQSDTVASMTPTMLNWYVDTYGINGSFITDANGEYAVGAQTNWHPIKVTVPTPFSTAGDWGTCCIAQVIDNSTGWESCFGTPSLYTLEYYNSYDGINEEAQNALDGNFPYLFGSTADGTQISTGYTWTPTPTSFGYSGDRPSEPLPNGLDWIADSRTDSYTTWVMYLPPGTNSVYVPIWSMNWGWSEYSVSENATTWDIESLTYTPGLPANTSTFPLWCGTVPYAGLTMQPAK